MCALDPPKPKELTLIRRMPSSGQGVSFVGTEIRHSLKGMRGLGLWKCRLGGIKPCSNICIDLMIPAKPATDSRCPIYRPELVNQLINKKRAIKSWRPTFVFTEPTQRGLSLSCVMVFAIAFNSAKSPADVPVP